jgi:hypothetical protein
VVDGAIGVRLRALAGEPRAPAAPVGGGGGALVWVWGIATVVRATGISEGTIRRGLEERADAAPGQP